MHSLKFKWLIVSLFTLSCAELTACREGNSKLSQTTAVLEKPSSATNSGIVMPTSQSVAVGESSKKIIFVTPDEFSGDLIKEAKALNLGNDCHEPQTGLSAANCICNSWSQQMDDVPLSVPNEARFKALLQGNGATTKDTLYYNVVKNNNGDPEVGILITKATGKNLLGFGESAVLSGKISEAAVKVWTGFTPSGDYEVDAVGNMAAGIYNYFWITQQEINAILNISKNKINRAALNQVKFACGKLESPYESATLWASVESTLNIALDNESTFTVARNGVTGQANTSTKSDVNQLDNYSSWGYTTPPAGAIGCAEKRHLYCVQQ